MIAAEGGFVNIPSDSAGFVSYNDPMHFRLTFAIAIAAIIAMAINDRASGQCQPQWLPGEDIPGFNDTVLAVTTWDPDGEGPLPQTLVVGGTFTISGHTIVNYVAQLIGMSWQLLVS